MIDFIINLLDRLFRIREPHKSFLVRALPAGLNASFCFGGMAFTAFLTSAFTGLLLSVYYVPSASEAYKSVLVLTDDVWGGWLVRSLHKWSASVLIVLVVLHTLRVFVYRAYRPPRELNWIAGCLTLAFVMASGFTGYLLPWDQKAYWATVVGTSMAGTVPVIGGFLIHLLRGGADVDGATLIRFYSLHVMWLPFMMILVLWAHFHMVKRQGISGGL